MLLPSLEYSRPYRGQLGQLLVLALCHNVQLSGPCRNTTVTLHRRTAQQDSLDDQ